MGSLAAVASEATKRRFMRRDRPRGEACLNCGAEISDRFCPHCGQENTPADLTLRGVFKEFLTELAYYDSKIWRTLRNLLFHPGSLSKEWSAGKRVSFLSPIRLYLTVTALFFIVAAWRTPSGINVQANMSPKDVASVIHSIAKSRLSPKRQATALLAESRFKLTPEQKKAYEDAVGQAGKNYEAALSKGTTPTDSANEDFPGLEGNSWLRKQLQKLQSMASDDPKIISSRYFEQIPKALFVVLPLCAVVLKLMYVRQRRTYVEHLVFLLHFHSFVFLALLPATAFSNDVTALYAFLAVMFWMPAYGFLAMKRYYGQVWWVTLLKSWLLGFWYVLLASGGAMLALLLMIQTLPDPPASSQAKANSLRSSTQPTQPSSPSSLAKPTP